MENFSAMHGIIGAAVVLLNIIVGIVLIRPRRESKPINIGLKLLAYIGQLSLLIQILLGLDLWMRGARPAPGAWAWIHLILPIGALGFAIMALMRSRKADANQHAAWLSKAAWHTTLVAIVTYLIGELGSR